MGFMVSIPFPVSASFLPDASSSFPRAKCRRSQSRFRYLPHSYLMTGVAIKAILQAASQSRFRYLPHSYKTTTTTIDPEVYLKSQSRFRYLPHSYRALSEYMMLRDLEVSIPFPVSASFLRESGEGGTSGDGERLNPVSGICLIPTRSTSPSEAMPRRVVSIPFPVSASFLQHSVGCGSVRGVWGVARVLRGFEHDLRVFGGGREWLRCALSGFALRDEGRG